MSEPAAIPLVSVIVPVHNAGDFLRPCLESVLRQTLGSLEVVVVDDASTDDGPQVLVELQALDARLRVVTADRNVGVSVARNMGLDEASGEFIAFVDADDYVEPAMYETMLRTARKLRAEVVSCGIDVVDPTGTVTAVEPFPLTHGRRHDSSEMRDLLHRAFARRLLWYPFRSVYRRDLITRHGLRFDASIRKGEDSLFNLQALFFADGVASIGETMYHYRKHPGSATARPLASESSNITRLGEQVIAFHRRHGFDSRADADFYAQVLRSDLPTALVRLRGHPSLATEARALLSSPPVKRAFRTHALIRLGVPPRVLCLLLLCRLGWTGVLRLILDMR